MQQATKDPYHLEFLGLDTAAQERDVEQAMIDQLDRFLRELGDGFAYVGRQWRLDVDGDEFFIDLLMFHANTNRHVVIELSQVIDTIPPSRAGTRNRALFLVGFAADLRRSELAALQLEDIEDVDEGLIVTITSSKTDQTSQGDIIGIPYGAHPPTCPVRAHQNWVTTRGTQPGPWLLRINRGDHLDQHRRGITGAAINNIIQNTCTIAGLPASYSGHSLRAGFITSAAEYGVPQWVITNQSRHKSPITNTANIQRGTFSTPTPPRSWDSEPWPKPDRSSLQTVAVARRNVRERQVEQPPDKKVRSSPRSPSSVVPTLEQDPALSNLGGRFG